MQEVMRKVRAQRDILDCGNVAEQPEPYSHYCESHFARVGGHS